MIHSDHYATTAFDSTKPRELPRRTPATQLSFGARALRGKETALAWGIYFGDYRNTNSRSDILELKHKDKQSLMAEVSPEHLQFPTMRNPKAAWAMVRGVAGLMLFVACLTVITIWLVDGDLSLFSEKPLGLLIPGVPLVIFLIGTIAVPLVENKNNIIFNRRTGMISLPKHFSGKEEDIRFDEFDGYLRYGFDGKSGATFFRLHIGHRYSSRGFDAFDRFYKPAYAYQAWEYIQQFMDTARPLPDLALFEPVRQLDPATVEYDKCSGRPPNFWRDRDPDEVEKEIDEVDAVVREFFWESLPRGNDPYIQEASILAWRSYYPEQAAVADSLKTKGWWPGMERGARVIPFPQA